jgi:hypothetical protein
MAHASSGQLFIHDVLKFSQNLLQIVVLASYFVTNLIPIASAESIADANPKDLSQNIPTTPAVITQPIQTLPIGLMVNGKNVLPSGGV